MRRSFVRVVTRRAIVTVALLTILSFVLFRHQETIASSAAIWSSGSLFDCPSNRTNPFHIPAPAPADSTTLKSIWHDLHSIFEANPPVPRELKTPIHPSGADIPTKEQLGRFFALSDEDAKTTRRRHQEVVKKLPPYPDRTFAGRGIVMLAGGRYSEFAATSLGVIRELQSKLPVEVWYSDAEEDMPGWCRELKEEGMACRQLSDYIDVTQLKHPYAFKVFTMLFSRFSEILYLDADSCPIVNPDQIFDSEAYRKNGAIFWPDYWPHTGSPWLPYLTGMAPAQSEMLMDDKSVESGQMVWDKERHWKSLLLATYYNYYGPEFWYTVFNNGWAGWGDKDTFPMALKALKEPYFQVKHAVATVFVAGTIHGVGMLQANPQNTKSHEPMFLHSNIIKWSMRNMACRQCESFQNHNGKSHLENQDSPIYTHLNEGKRIFSMPQMDEKNIDPEPILWKAIEWTACKSRAWGNDQLCQQTRSYMESALGIGFRTARIASAVGNGKQVCMIEPTVYKRPPPS